MYPVRTDCDGLAQLFTGSDGEVDLEAYKQHAEHDLEETSQFRGAGYYMCYCKKNSKASEALRDEDDLCYKYQKDKSTGLALTTTVTILVSIINIVIRTINIKLINAIGYDTESK